MPVFASDSILPPLLVFPLAAIALLVCCGHLIFMQHARMPQSRRRIRTVSGVLSLFTITLTAIGFGSISAEQARVFLLVWLSVVSLLGILVMLAAIDMANNIRLHNAERKRIRTQLTRLQDELRVLAQKRHAASLGLPRDERPDDA